MFMSQAIHAASYSNDPSTKVGSVIVVDGSQISVGWNTFPDGVEQTPERWNNRDEKYPRVVHAEANALINGCRIADLRGGTLYTTEFPCCSCCGLIIQHGIKRVVSQCLSSDYAERWAEQIEISKSMFIEARVELVEIPR